MGEYHHTNMVIIRLVSMLLWAVVVWSFQQDPIEFKPIDDRIGTLLITESPIAFTSLTWRLIFEWNLEPLTDTLKTLQYINKNLTRFKVASMEKQAILHGTEALQTAEDEFENFLSLVKGTKHWYNGTRHEHSQGKRQVPSPDKIAWDAWKGSSGSLLGSVFGMASEEEMSNVHSLLDTLFRREAKMVTVQRLHLTAVSKLQSQIDGQQQQLDRVVNVTLGLYKSMGNTWANKTEATMASMLLHNDFINVVTMFRAAINGHRQILAALDRGYLDSGLISAKVLQDSLIQVRDQIPAGFKLIFDPIQTGLTPYYNLKLASRIVGSGHIRGILQVPLTGMADDFTLYKSVPFPSSFSSDSERRFILKDSTRYVAITRDKRRLVDLDTVFNIGDCLQGPTLVCPATSPELTDPTSNCIFHLISGNMRLGATATKCTMAEVTNEDVYLQGIDSEEWAMSSVKEVLVQASCINLNSSTTAVTNYPGTSMKGDLVLQIPRYCTAEIDHHVVPMRLLMTTKLGRLPSRLNLPTLHTHQLLELHGTQILDDKFDQELNRAVKEMLESRHDMTFSINSSSKEVKKIVFEMQREINKISQIQPVIRNDIISGSTLFICMGVLIIVVLWVKRRVRIVDRTWKFASDSRRGGLGEATV